MRNMETYLCNYSSMILQYSKIIYRIIITKLHLDRNNCILYFLNLEEETHVSVHCKVVGIANQVFRTNRPLRIC